jgi:hypothetical protein
VVHVKKMLPPLISLVVVLLAYWAFSLLKVNAFSRPLLLLCVLSVSAFSQVFFSACSLIWPHHPLRPSAILRLHHLLWVFMKSSRPHNNRHVSDPFFSFQSLWSFDTAWSLPYFYFYNSAAMGHSHQTNNELTPN